MPAGRPPLPSNSPQDDEENYEGEEQQQCEGEEGQYNEHEEQAENDDEENNNNGQGDEEGEEQEEAESSSGDSEEALQYVSPPEEKPFPPSTHNNPFHYIIDLGAIASDATPGNDTRKLVLPAATENDPRFPKWLHYILNDDFASLSYLIHPPPGAEIDLTTMTKNHHQQNQNGKQNKGKKKSKNGNQEEDEDDVNEETSRPSSTARDSQGNVIDDEDDEGDLDSEGNPRRNKKGGGRGDLSDELAFHPNEKFLLTPSEDKPNEIWNIVPYELPKPPRFLNGGDRPESGLSGRESARSNQSGNDGTHSQVDSQHANQQPGDNDASKMIDGGDEDGEENGPNGDVARGVVVDVLVLAALFSPDALAMCVKERKKPLKNDPEDQKKPQYDEDGNLVEDANNNDEEEAVNEEDMDDETLIKRRRSPPTLRCFWKFCERFAGGVKNCHGIYTNECKPLTRLIEAQSKYQEEEIVEPKKLKNNKNNKPKKMNFDEEDNEGENDENDGEKKFDPDAETETEKKMTRAQKRRLFLDYNRAFDLIVAAPTSAAAQNVESIIKTMITNANISPDAPIDLKPRALRNINTLSAYVTLMEHIPRSVVTQNAQAWLEPVPLTEEEINAFPEGTENIPDEHPPKIPPTLWKIFQQVRRRTAKESKGKDAPKRSLLEVLKKFFTPLVEGNNVEPGSIDTKKKETPAVIHSDKYPLTYDEEFDDLAKTVDPCFTTSSGETIENDNTNNNNNNKKNNNSNNNSNYYFDAQRDYLPNKLSIYLSDIVLILLSRHDFAAASFKWLGELKRDFPHTKWDSVSSSHILAFTLNRMAVCNALETVSSLLRPEWLSSHDRISIDNFIPEVICVNENSSTSSPSNRPLDTGSFFAPKVLETFARRFARVFFENDKKYLTLVKKSGNNEELFQLMMRMEINRQEFEQFALDLAGWSTPTKQAEAKLQDKLQCFSETLGFESLICTPKMLKTAVDAKNVDAVRFLIRSGRTTRVAHARGDIPVLEYCVETKNEPVLIALIEDYGNVHQTLRGGQRDVFAAIQENFVPPPDAKKIFFRDDIHHQNTNNNQQHHLSTPMYVDLMASVKRVEAAIREAEAKRGADPTALLGIQIGSRV